jgi:hypothetical protein
LPTNDYRDGLRWVDEQSADRAAQNENDLNACKSKQCLN